MWTAWSDIRFWILLFFLLRLIGITNPPLEVGHNWRQTTVTMVARNFLEVDDDVRYPRIDIAGELTGITGMEFPLLNYGMYASARVFGYAHWHGRLIVLILSSIGIFYFFKVLRLYFDERLALYAALLLMGSIWFSFSRKIMPDTFAVSLAIVSLYHGIRYLKDDPKITRLLLYVVFGSLALLSKLPSAVILAVLAPVLWVERPSLSRLGAFILASLVLIAPACYWYFTWVPHLVQEFSFWHFFMGTDLAIGFGELLDDPGKTAKRFYDTAMKYSGFAVFLFGLVVAIKQKAYKVILPLICVAIPFAVIMGKAGWVFYHHTYYVIPFVPVMALAAAYGLNSDFLKRWAPLLLAIVLIENVANQMQDFRIKQAHYLQLEADLDRVTTPQDLIAIDTGPYPTAMYFAHRKGWVTSKEQLTMPTYIDSLVSKGLKAIVRTQLTSGPPIAGDFILEVQEDNYEIYVLKKGSQYDQ